MNPKLLTHPNIPKPLHGMNPRTLLGQEWWDIHRREAYAKEGFHCWACGIHKHDAEYHQWLEGHESYDIDYDTGRVELQEIVALCHSCHNFIHSGRLLILFVEGEVSEKKFRDVYLRGFKILRQSGLKPFWGTAQLWLRFQGKDDFEIDEIMKEKKLYPEREETAEWNEWHLVLEGKKYYSRFKNYEAWAKHYAKGGQ